MSLKQQLGSGEPQFGLWLGLANAYTAEEAPGAGCSSTARHCTQHPKRPQCWGSCSPCAVRSRSWARPQEPDPDQAVPRPRGTEPHWCPWSAIEVVAATRYPPAGAGSGEHAQPSNRLRGRRRTTSEWPTSRSACSCRSSRPPVWSRSGRWHRCPEWTVSAPIWQRRWPSSATPGHPAVREAIDHVLRPRPPACTRALRQLTRGRCEDDEGRGAESIGSDIRFSTWKPAGSTEDVVPNS